MKFKKIFLAFIFLAGLSVALFFFAWQKAKDRVANDAVAVNWSTLPATLKSVASNTVLSAPEPSSKVSVNSNTKQVAFAGALPPPNLPLAQIVDLLKKDSGAGNYRASCRLGAELFRCQLHPLMIKEMAKLQQSLALLEVGSEKHLNAINKIKITQTKIDSDATVCDGFINPDNLEAWRFNFTAALQGHIASKAQFVISPPLNPVEFYKNMDGWAAYSEYAPTFLLESARAGNNRAAWSLARAYAGEPSIPGLGNLGGVELAKPDPYQAAIYAHTLANADSEPSTQRAAARLIKQIEQQLTTEQIAAAKVESAALRTTWPSPASNTIANTTAASKEQRGFDAICDEP